MVRSAQPWTASAEPARIGRATQRRDLIEPNVVDRLGQAGHADDRSIVEAVLSGDREAFRTIVDRESAAVVRTCHRVLGDHGEAEDAAQETFVTAFRSLATWRADGPLGAWIARIAVRTSVRRAGRRRPIAWIEPHESVVLGQQLPGGPDPAVETLRTERAADVRSAVSRLDEPYRETVALRFFGELSLAEIAGQTGRPVGTVKTHLHRGLRRLRDELGAGW